MKPICFLQELITEDTSILELRKDPNITPQQKYSVLGLSDNIYIHYMYYQNLEWYYFKQEEKDFKQEEKSDGVRYPFYLLDELMGSYLAHFIELPTISFQVAKTDTFLGLASRNFRKEKYDYYFFDQLPVKGLLEFSTTLINIEVLKSLCINSINIDKLTDHIMKLLALDLYMLQRDRSVVNLQFQIDRDTRFFDLAPIYDFSNCADRWEYSTFFTIWNPIISLNCNNISILCKRYPQVLEYFSILLEKTMDATWNQICEDYHFNQNCYAYEQAKEHYQLKDENQKKLFKVYLEDVQTKKISI